MQWTFLPPNRMLYIFTELDGYSGIKNVITDRLNLGELQVDDILAKIRYGRKYKEIYANQVNQASSRCFFSIFSKNCGKGMSTVFRQLIMHVLVASCWVLRVSLYI